MTIMLRPVKGDMRLDIVVDDENRQFAVENGLCTMVAETLGTNRRAPPNLLDQNGQPFSDPQGWALDLLDDEPYGCLLWTLERRKLTPGTELLARQYAEQGLSWMVRDGIVQRFVIASKRVDKVVDGQGRVLQRHFGGIVLDVAAKRPPDPEPRFVLAWNVTLAQPCDPIDAKPFEIP